MILNCTVLNLIAVNYSLPFFKIFYTIRYHSSIAFVMHKKTMGRKFLSRSYLKDRLDKRTSTFVEKPFPETALVNL